MDLGSARGSRAGFGGLAETIFFTTQHTKIFGIRNAEDQTECTEVTKSIETPSALPIAPLPSISEIPFS
jgi:hypothetical protein